MTLSSTRMPHRSERAMQQIVFLYSVVFFVRYSTALYAHSYFDGMSKRCRESSSCFQNTSRIFSISRTCQCDAQCATYGDCCQDSPHFKPSPLKQECVTAGNWNTPEDFRDNYYMVTSCPSSWMDEGTRFRCENYNETIRREPILGHPVTSNATNITYANYHCARCNGDLRISTMIRWKLAVTCDAKLTLPVPDIDTVIRESTYGEDFKFKSKFSNVSYRSCQLYVWRPFNLLRRCHKSITVSCPPRWHNDKVRTQCESYTSLVFMLKYQPYRNPHCATCNNVSNPRMGCEKEDLEIETWFPILFDVSDKYSNVVGQTRLCKIENEAYDPIAKKCRSILWSIAGINGDYGLDDCYGNMSCNIQNNCSLFVIEPEEYLMNDDLRVTVLTSNRTYGLGEFIRTEDGRIKVCAEYQITEEKFNGFIKYFTFLGLGISVGFLVLYLAVFATNPALRNLSDKILASFCTALLFAYGAFITGQLLNVGGLACKVTAIATYYSFLSSFSWLLLMAFDFWNTLRQTITRLRVVSVEKRRCAFLVYSTLAWLLLPAVVVSAAVIVEYGQAEPTFRPGFGVENCWFGNRKALLVFFVVPVGVIMVLNCCFFVSSAYMICTNTVSVSNSSASIRRNHKLFARLSLLMGLTWTVGFVAGFVDSEVLWYIFVALNAFQGLFIFLAFGWNKKVRSGYRTQVSGNTRSTRKLFCSWPRNRTITTGTTDLRNPLKTKRTLISGNNLSGSN